MSQSPSPQPEPSRSQSAQGTVQESHFNRARASLREALTRHSLRIRPPGRRILDTKLQAALKTELERLTDAQAKLEQGLIRIAVFGLVSRGKSAVLNALLGQKVLQTGPLNGVTQYPRSVRWTPATNRKVQVELIDTPGLDEVNGQTRADMAREIAQQADLILFVVAGDITRTEYQALCELREAQKPLILVFNKIDLYPDQDRQQIYQRLQQLGAIGRNGQRLRQLLSTEEIVMVAAEPAPIQVKVEWPDGQVTYDWESPPAQMQELQLKLLEILNREGRSLLALNALRQASEVETAIADKTLDLLESEADELIWRFTRYKALAVALNPIAILDLLGGAIADLALIRALAKLYGLPITSYQVGQLWKKVLLSSGGLTLSELGSGFLLGLGKSTAAIGSAIDSSAGVTAYAGAAIAQASLAGYGTYAVGRAAQIYLKQGCTWGPQGSDTIIQEILAQVDSTTILHRLRQELQQHLNST